MTRPPSSQNLRLLLSGVLVATTMLAAIAVPASAADLKKLADELVNQSEQPAASNGDLDGDGHSDMSAKGIEKSDIRRGMKVDAGNSLNAHQANAADPKLADVAKNTDTEKVGGPPGIPAPVPRSLDDNDGSADADATDGNPSAHKGRNPQTGKEIQTAK